MKLKFFAAVSVVAVAVFIAASQINRQPFAPAEELPREALVYVQIEDLPALVKLWNESDFKNKYLESENFRELKNRHLGLKLASRWEEFSTAAGFPIDLETLGALAETKAAVALYDIGKLEFVFIAPVSDEIFAATKFVQNQDKFAAETLSDGTIIYRANVEADRGRQRQQLVFTHLKNRFVAATSEKLLAQTLDNINEKSAKNRLIDEPAFKILSEKTEPHTATVWVNQSALNDDYYFKQYWLMSDVSELKNIRAGIFDFEMQEGKFVERRKFLLNRAVNAPRINSAEILSSLPADVPFYRLRAADNQAINGAIQETIFNRQKNQAEDSASRRHYYSADDSGEYYAPDYYLDEKFDEAIDETEDETKVFRRKRNFDFAKILQSANSQSVLTFTSPMVLPAPLFVEFRRAAVFQMTGNFDRASFESEIARAVAAERLVYAPNAELQWTTRGENEIIWRELDSPLLGSASYAIRGDRLILSDSPEFLREIIAAENTPNAEKLNSSLTELTTLNLNQRENAYNRIFAELAEKKAADEFFTGSVAGLLDAVSDVKKIEARKFYSNNLAQEEL